MTNVKQLLTKKKNYEKMKEGIRMIKSSDKLNNEEGQKPKTTEVQVKIVGMYKIKKKYFFNKY